MPRAFVTLDLGFGDASKGSITEALVRRHGIKLVARYSGGCQAAHHVVLEDGAAHCFSQYGSGTLAGAGTLLTEHVLIDPIRMMNERKVLIPKIANEPTAYVAGAALVVTPYHAALNRLKERARGEGRHGSCGVGIGETAKYGLAYWDALRIRDLSDRTETSDRLKAIKDRLKDEALEAWETMGNPFRADATEDLMLFETDQALEALIERYAHFTKTVNIIDNARVHELISSQDTVWEGAQGVLLDEDYGFHPYTTWSRVTLCHATETLQAAGITEVTNIGILRAYCHRHGAGPFPTENEGLRPLYGEPHNGTNAWQGVFRVGYFDLPLARYALKVASGTQYGIHWQGCPIHQLALTHLDKIQTKPYWDVVTNYGLDLGHVPSPDDWSKRERLTAALMGVCQLDWSVKSVQTENVPHWIEDHLTLPIGILSRGATYADKIFAPELKFKRL